MIFFFLVICQVPCYIFFWCNTQFQTLLKTLQPLQDLNAFCSKQLFVCKSCPNRNGNVMYMNASQFYWDQDISLHRARIDQSLALTLMLLKWNLWVAEPQPARYSSETCGLQQAKTFRMGQFPCRKVIGFCRHLSYCTMKGCSFYLVVSLLFSGTCMVKLVNC